MFFTRFALAATLSVSVFAARIAVRQDDSSVGQTIDTGLAANRSAPANETFGTAELEVNFLTLPTTLCVVPQTANEAGIKPNETATPLITQQALELCPQAKTIVCSNATSTNTTTEA